MDEMSRRLDGLEVSLRAKKAGTGGGAGDEGK